MRVRVTQLDGKLPNLALMRLSAWHRERGDELRYSHSPYRGLDEPDYDRVYGSAIFEFSAEQAERLQDSYPSAIIGGTWNKKDRIAVEDVIGGAYDYCDYSAYPEFTGSLGFTMRGCRFMCGFCDVPSKEGKPRATGTIAQIWRGDPWPRHLHLLDNDFFGVPKATWKARLVEVREGGFKVCFNQGVNIRVITDEIAGELSSVDYRDDSFKTRRLYTAWDSLSDEELFFRGVDRLERAGVSPRHLLVYMLVGFDQSETWETVLYRFHRMQDRGIRPFPMPIVDKRGTTLPRGDAHPDIERRRMTLAHFQRWAIRFAKLGVPFHQYDANAKGWADKSQHDLFAEAAE